MVFGMAAAFITFILISVFKKGAQKPIEKEAVKLSLLFGFIGGACNCGSNFLTLYLAAAENASILFPILSAANALLSCIIGRVIFKEKLSVLQIISIGLGIASVVLLKL
jgi:multidrug transporter EmrE-like cation transporter